jgi:hypothetical protein
MLPRSQQCLLHDVFCAMAIPADEPKDVAHQRSGVLVVERPDEIFVGHRCPHILGTPAEGAWFSGPMIHPTRIRPST